MFTLGVSQVMRKLNRFKLHLQRTAHITFILPPANEVWGTVMFLHLCVILFGGWLPSMQHGSHDEGGLHPGGLGRPLDALRDKVNKWVVRILLECILVFYCLCTSTPANKKDRLKHFRVLFRSIITDALKQLCLQSWLIF